MVYFCINCAYLHKYVLICNKYAHIYAILSRVLVGRNILCNKKILIFEYCLFIE